MRASVSKTRVEWNFTKHCPTFVGRCSDLLRAGRSGDRIPAEARFSAPLQTGHGAHPASCTMRTASSPGVNRPGRGVFHPPPSSAEFEERVELYIYSPSGPSWPVLGWPLHLPFIIKLLSTIRVENIENVCQYSDSWPVSVIRSNFGNTF